MLHAPQVSSFACEQLFRTILVCLWRHAHAAASTLREMISLVLAPCTLIFEEARTSFSRWCLQSVFCSLPLVRLCIARLAYSCLGDVLQIFVGGLRLPMLSRFSDRCVESIFVHPVFFPPSQPLLFAASFRRCPGLRVAFGGRVDPSSRSTCRCVLRLSFCEILLTFPVRIVSFFSFSVEVSYEPPSAELYKFSGTVTVNPSDALMTGRHSALGWGRASLPHLHMSSQRTSPLVTPPAATPRHLTTPSIGGTPLSAAPGRSRLHSQSDVHSGVEECRAEGGGRGVGGLSVRQESNPGRTARSSDALLALPGTGAKHERGGGLLSRESSTSQARNVQRKSRPGGGGGQGRGSVPSPAPTQFGVDISQFLWRGATLRNTAWAYGVVLYTGAHTRIMKNTRSRELKYSRLQVYYNQHALLLAIAQVLDSPIAVCSRTLINST